MVRIKFCGMTQECDVLAAAALGVDAMGFVFYEQSPRYVSPEKAQGLVAAMPPFITSVGVFAQTSSQQVTAILTQVPLDLLQFHGDESAEFCRQFQRPYIKALRIHSGVDIIRASREYGDAKALLLDAYHPAQLGGQGVCFDWDLIPKNCSLPIILAGGLSAENVQRAIFQVAPYGVDVSSGIEQEPGRKDLNKMQSFISEVRRAQ